MPRDMSWLSPKRRRTTTALPTVQNTRKNGVEDEGPLSPSPRFTSPKPVLPSPGLSQRPARTFSSASSTSAHTSYEGEGNLFYAYARRADDLHSRYLLTFASAHIANEWWSLIQACFPDTTRPGPQLFSFKVDNLLEKAWKHSAIAHLKPKWMYIQFDASAGSATQGIIPVQDAQGNMLGGASSSTEQQFKNETRRNMNTGVSMLEERFEKMMEVVERNSEQISALSEAQENGRISHNGTGEQTGANGISELTSHLDRISQLLEKNCAHVAGLTERQMQNEQKMAEMLEARNAKQNSEQPDMSQLTAHLDRIQRLMERNTHGRKDSARDIRTSPPRIDLSPLTFWLEKVLGAVEQNSELVRELLHDREESKRSLPAPATASAQQIEIDLSPLSQRLDDLLDAQEAKASRDQDAYAQMSHSLDKIIEAQHKAVERGPFDVSLLSQRLDEILSVHRNAATAPLAEKLDQLVEISKEPIDFAPISEQLEHLAEETASLREHLDLSPLTEPLEAIRNATEQNGEHLMGLLESQTAPEQQEGEGQEAEENVAEEVARQPRHLEPMLEHLEALRSTTEQNSITMTELLESLAVNRQVAPEETTSKALTPFDDHADPTPEHQHEGKGMGGTKFLLSALSSHLSKIQAVTEANANAVRSTRESSHALQRSMTAAVSDTSNNVRTLAAKHKDLAAQVAVREGQVREVVRTQSEMVECVRELAKTIKTQERPACNHVVIPPPRKTNRKVVGFVYDAKDGKA